MKRVDIKIGYLCNNQCSFCVQGDRRKTLGNKPGNEIKAAIKKAKKACAAIVFTGGEATLRGDFFELVSYAKDLGFKSIQIQTNGRMFAYLDFCRKAILAGATEFSPALHGDTAKLHDLLTNAPGSFKQTLEGIRNLKKLGQRVLTNTVITSKNYKRLPAIARLLVSLGVDQFQFAFIHIAGTADKNKDWIVPKKFQIMPYVKKGLDIGIKAGKQVMTEAIPYCLMSGYEGYVAEDIIPEGQVVEYTGVIEDYSAFRKKYGKGKTASCRHCVYFKRCEGPWKEYPALFGWEEFKPVLKLSNSLNLKH